MYRSIHGLTIAAAFVVACSDASYDELFEPSQNSGFFADSGARSDGAGRFAPDAPPLVTDARGADVGRSDDPIPSADIDSGLDAPTAERSPDTNESSVVSRDGAADAAPNPGGPLHGQRWELKCTTGPLAQDKRLCSSLPPGLTACPSTQELLTRTITFGGRSGARYSVTLRLRGVVELKMYVGGASTGSHFQAGGSPSADSVNVYGMSVSSPSQTYYINANHSGVDALVLLDDTVTIPIDAGAKIEIFATDSDCLQLRNCVDPAAEVCVPYLVAGVPPAPVAFDGQFAQIDVVASVVQ
jgi:hypothetical protein